ncbi:50S ribosomal protein L7/L12 [Thermoflexales bacterium]|jgi:large subunit ribosomal protein L7/L12|nr:50S ribosomal protein L7/L12 [Thermoflexales bacterium]
MSEKLDKIVADLDSLTLMEAAELSKLLQDKWGVSAAAPIMMGAMAAGGAPAAAAPVEEKTEFDVVLKDGGAKKIEVIKVVRQLIPSLGLKEAKDMVDGAPQTVLSAVSKEAAADAKAKLETAGAGVEVK